MLDQIASFIQGHDSFTISTHMSPDGDAVSSALGMYWILKKLDKKAVVVMCDPVPRHLDFLPGVEKVLLPKEWDEVHYEQAIVVDSGNAKRVGDQLYEGFRNKFVINLDHHVDNPGYGNMHYVAGHASATMVIDELREALGVPLDQTLATCFYTGLFSDTNGYRNANVDESVLDISTKWVGAGADPHFIAKNLFERQSWPEMQLLGYALSETHIEDKIIWCAIPHEIFGRFGVHPNDTDGIVGQLRSVDGIEVSAFFKEIDQDKVKVSLRTKSDLPVNSIAQHFGGGGHVKAAGCLIHDTLENATQMVIEKVREHMTAAQP